MSTDTVNYGFKKDNEDEFYNVNVVNANLDKIDTEMKRIEDTIPTVSPTDSVKWLETVGGTANALTANIPDIESYKNGLAVSFPVNANSTAAMTLNINGLGAIPIKKANGTAFSNAKANGVYTVRYRAGAFILQGEGGVGTAKPEDVVKDKTFTNDEGEQVGTLKVYNSGEKIPTSKVTAGYRSQWIAAPVNYGGAFPTGVDKDGNVYMITNPDNRDSSVTTLAKYSPTGSLVNKITLSDPNRPIPSGVTVNGDFLSFYSGRNVFIYNLDLTQLAVIPLGNSGIANRVAITNTGDVYVAINVYQSVGGDKREIRKYNRYGSLIWTKPVDNNADVVDMRLLSDNNIVIATGYGGYSVVKIQASNGATLWTVALYTIHSAVSVYISSMKNVIELSDGSIMVSYGGGNSSYTPYRNENLIRVISSSGAAGSAIAINNLIGEQYSYPLNLCTDGNGGAYFGTGAGFYWREVDSTTISNMNYNIIGRLNKNLQIVWNQILSQSRNAYIEHIQALTYEPLFDSVIMSQSQGTWSYGIIRKWDWYVSLK
ncbi:hypothetical protein J2D69_06170 [Lysinibacillus sphaericus]|uniref:Uncharacterized protein n=3 Tax=Lysinibacillus TaxID=400634 RepID=B1HSB2_LYSSC|nr:MULTISPECIES: hypothetical protein [Lysinibacillus]MBE5085362.1 hypothetical protein [Bacillus thuringiensis]ACA39383.1 conserved hypothetical protein [Lysinibacillus sphaericus C3-41]AMO34431.1 hypothetical protein AR327_19360 [Lysinibacillus sphaericus]AMR90456.1 hypothetical protein A1T07_09850 [Lysinibacillus sphaericus]ANA44505.1 hypothetical protein A2J09_02520 [Lysinibacillus sphaericus]